jgi:hypothetical protein
MKMKLYYIAYDYTLELEMIDGPYGTYLEASNERDVITNGVSDEKLVIVCETKDMEIL